MSDYARTTNYQLYKPIPGQDDDVWGDHLNANADTLDGLIKQLDLRGTGGGVLLVTDYLPPGQPDGSTDNSLYIQEAINAAAGQGALLIPANAAIYVAQGLVIPSNAHLIIEAGATLRLPNGANQSLFTYADNATSTLVELYGTLDGNASAQTGGGGLVSGGPGGDPPFISHSAIRGNGIGLVTNFANWPVCMNAATDVEISGLSFTNSGFNIGGSASFAGQVQRPTAGSPHIVSGTYTGATGIVSVITNVAHGIVPGEQFSPVNLTGTGGFDQNAGTSRGSGYGAIFIALPGTAGTTLVYQGTVGAPNGTITGGQFDLWATPVAAIASGTYTNTNVNAAGAVIGTAGTVSITTAAPHGLVYGQRVIVNATAGAGASLATGVFILLPGTSGTTLRYNAPFSGSAGTVTTTPITAGTVSLSTKSYDSGFVNCYADNINDFGIALYGGCENCYIRDCEVTRTNGGGPTIYSDLNNGRNVNCEISGCVVHNTYSSGIVVACNLTAATHLNCRVFDNSITGCVHGMAIGSIDGLDVYNNRFNANKSGAIMPGNNAVGELSVNSFSGPATRVNIFGNSIRDAGGGGATASTLVPITGGTYSSATGQVNLTRGAGTNLFPGCIVVFANAAGTGAAASLNGMWTCTAGTNGSTVVNFAGPAGLGAITITGGQVWPAVFGIQLYLADQCRIFGNYIGDAQANKTMYAAIGGQWGSYGYSAGNYYGPQVLTAGNFPADQSIYQNYSQQGISYDLVTGFHSGLALAQPLLQGPPAGGYPGNPTLQNFPPSGLTIGQNYSLGNNTGPGRDEIDFYCGTGAQYPGGFDFIKIISIHVVSGTYTSGTGAVSLVTNVAHGIAVGAWFTLSAVTGTGTDINRLNGQYQATAGTTGTTLNYTLPLTGLNILTVTNGSINTTNTDGGIIDVTAGVGGSLLANDGYGNTRLGGALHHGALQSQAVTTGQTLTIQPNTSFVAVRNSASIAAATIVLPVASGNESWQLPQSGITNNELEINFQNPVGTLTVTPGGTLTVSGAPSTIAAAGTSINFIQVGAAWLRRIMA